MKSSKIFTIILIIALIAVVYFVMPKNNQGGLASPVGKLGGQQSSPEPQVPNYNPPKEIEYDSNTDLGQELDKVDPKVLNSDFDPINNL